MTETNGRGVDLVLNSLSEEKLQASIRCLAHRGRFLEIGKFDLANNSPLGRPYFMSLTIFVGVIHFFVLSLYGCIESKCHYYTDKSKKKTDSAFYLLGIGAIKIPCTVRPMARF
jgi:NADPH:quinone reductase-like Zn-dependent oxidoreductase